MSSQAKTSEEFMRELVAAFESMQDAPGVDRVLPLLRESVKRAEKFGLCQFAEHVFENRSHGSLQDAIDSFHGWIDLREAMPV